MSSERCVHGCRPPYHELYNSPCPACRQWHDKQMDLSYQEYRLEREARAVDAFVPATDREAREWLDQVAPVESASFTVYPTL